MFRHVHVFANEIIASSSNTAHQTAAAGQENTSATGRAFISGDFENFKLQASAGDLGDSIAPATSGFESATLRLDDSAEIDNAAERQAQNGSVFRVMRLSTKTTERSSTRH